MKSLAVIGTGISGLSCAWFLRKHFKLTLFEKNNYPGGHTNTITVNEGSKKVALDTGFMVFNHVTYPLLTRLFRELKVATNPTDMSFSVQHRPSGLEYNGGNINLLFGQRRNLVSLRHWRMLFAIDRFNKEAEEALSDTRYQDCTLGEYITARSYGEDMLNLYLIPMAGAVWSSPPERMLDFPAMTLLRFWQNHGFLGLDKRHQWYTVSGGSQSYIKPLTADYTDSIKLNATVRSVRRTSDRVEVTLSDGQTQSFDKIVLACHGDQALSLLEDPLETEARLLSRFQYQKNAVIVHTDCSVMPRTKRCWASWNYRIDQSPEGGTAPSVHYWMNSLQGVSEAQDYFVSLNYENHIPRESVLREICYEHPLFDLEAIKAQNELPMLNRMSRGQTTYFAGAWFKYGFHEDGLASGLACARAISGEEDLWA